MRWKTKLLTLTLAVGSVGLASAQGYYPDRSNQYSYGPSIRVEVDGQPVQFQYGRPQMIGGRVMVPLRGVFEQLGAYVNWNSSTRTVTARGSDSNVEIQIGSRYAMVDGQRQLLDAPPMIRQGTTLVPLRFMSEALGASVQWMSQSRTVQINTYEAGEGGYSPNPPARTAKIESFTHSLTGSWAGGGRRLHLELRGTPGATVYFWIPEVVSDQRMHETRPGFYEADWTVPRNNDLNSLANATIMARMVVNGEERRMEANRRIGMDWRNPTVRAMSPADGDRIRRVRPRISATIDDMAGSGIRNRDWRMYVDDVEVTNNATFRNGTVTYVPTQNLMTGTHWVRLEATDRAGNRVSKHWSFVIER